MNPNTPLTHLLAILCLVGATGLAWPEAGNEPPVEGSKAQVRDAAMRSVQLIEKTSGAFLERRNCFTCHTQTLSAIVLREAREAGLSIDEQNFKSQVERVFELGHSFDGMRVDTIGHGLWTLDIGAHPPDNLTAGMTAYLLGYQKDLGHWEATVDRPPSEASNFTSNYVAIRGLNRYGTDDQQPQIFERKAAVRQWVATAKAVDTEDLTFRLRLAMELDLAAAEMDSFARALLKKQEPNGGWAQMAGMDPDPYATGSALVALHETGSLSTEDPAWRRGIAYLMRTQKADGSWHVVTRAQPIQEYFESGFPHEKDQFISAFATGWATQALLIALREPAEDGEPSEDEESGAADPSLVPPPDPTGHTKYSERYRILADLDGDGADDMLLSGGPETFGAMGGPWTVYLNRDGDHRATGEIWAHPMAIAFEPDQSRVHRDPKIRRHARIWVYLKASGSAGSFGYWRVGNDSVDEMKSVEIYPGDGGSDLGRAVYEAAFKQSPIPYRMERSTTTDDGKVTWTELQR